jgi:hypothetical protein
MNEIAQNDGSNRWVAGTTKSEIEDIREKDGPPATDSPSQGSFF